MPGTAIYTLGDVLVQFCFFTPLLFLIVYTLRAPWWRTIAGRCLATLASVFILVLLRSVLFLWGVLPARDALQPNALAWFSTAILGLAPTAFATLTWFLLREPVRRWWRRIRDPKSDGDPLTHSSPKTLSEFEMHKAEHPEAGGEVR